MMTREMARKKTCPLRVELAVTLSANLSSENVTAENKIKELISCGAEKCPKWRDEFVELGEQKVQCADNECTVFDDAFRDKISSIETYIKMCLNCYKHFGRCGG